MWLVGALGCATPQGAAAPAAAPTPESAGAECRTGVIGTSGSDPFVVPVLRTSPEPLELTGPLVARIRQLTGALVSVCGDATRTTGPALLVDAFELRQVDGREAYLGRVAVSEAGVFLEVGEGRPAVRLEDAPGQLADHAGEEAWVSGAWSDGGFVVTSFGVLAPVEDDAGVGPPILRSFQ